MATRDPVRLRVANQKAYLWDLQDIQYLRVQHHICGSLQGTLPQVTQQNVFLGLPLVLLPEEAVLLVRNQLAVLVDDPAAHLPPTPEQAASYAASRASAITAQREAALASEAERKAAMEAKHAERIAEKRREKEERRRAAAEKAGKEGLVVDVPGLKAGEPNTGAPAAAAQASSSSAASAALPVSAPPAQERDLETVPYTIIIEPRSSSFAWYDPSLSSATYTTLEAASAAGVWSYPQTPLQEARCRVFEDLWRRGYYMGGGLRFGGDFLVYPGDPLRYHSHFTLTVLSTPATTIMPLDLVAYGRLATAVKKAHLLASWDAEKSAALYASLEWAAFG
ncbi:tRNA-splicing endonuclease subunit [Rhodotorula kratochvilovae]